MQGIGNILAPGVVALVFNTIHGQGELKWRIVLGLGALPGILLAPFRTVETGSTRATLGDSKNKGEATEQQAMANASVDGSLVVNGSTREPLLAENGKEGSKAVARDRIDLVVCDILMPEKDGIEIILELRNSHPGLKIIAVSGGRLESGLHLHAARQLGADAGLEKPIHSAELLNLAARLTAGCD